MKPSGPAAARYLQDHALVLVTAESCTAGLIAARLAEVPGAGDVLESAFVAYAPGAKQQHLGVSNGTLERCNLTSEAVAMEMARGALVKSSADVAISNTGVADDADPEVEAGTQCFGWAFREGGRTQTFTETRVFEGSRNEIREAAADYALQRIAHYHRRFKPSSTPG